MKKPVSRPSDQNRRRLVTESFSVEWTHKDTRYRADIETWGASYEPSMPRLWSWVNLPMAFGVIPFAIWTGSPWLWAPAAAWLFVMSPAILAGSLAPRESLSPVSAAHDWFYRNRGDVDFYTWDESTSSWTSGIEIPPESVAEGPTRRMHLTRAEADAVMVADPDDPLWIKWGAWAWVRLLGWWAWKDCGERLKSWISDIL